MCMFMSELPSTSKTSGVKKQNLAMFLKPNKEKEFYRFRLLAFKSPAKNDRDFPFIERQIHEHWGKNDKGFNVVDDTITCLTTKWVNYDGDRMNDCPLCKQANKNFGAWKASGWKDKASKEKFKALGRKYEAIIPVYVVNDPNNPDWNNGKFRVFMFNDKSDYKKFLEVINIQQNQAKIAKQQTGKGYNIWNAENAVDFVLRMELVPEIRNEGKPNQYTYNARKITQMAFTKTPYDISNITKEAIDNFQFDDQYYKSSTVEELNAFYKKYYSAPVANIPDEDVDVFGDSGTTSAPAPVAKTNVVKKTEVENEVIAPSDTPEAETIADVEIPDEPIPAEDAVPSTPAEAKPESINDSDIDTLLAGLN